MRKTLAVVLTLSLVAAFSGCANDPPSRERIRARTAAFDQTIADLRRREQEGFLRVERARRTLRRWWRTDTKRFQRHAAAAGDYIW